MSTATAFGKIILLGEHACVYGAPALAAALDRGARAEARPSADGRSTLRLGGATLEPNATSDEPIARAFAALLAAGLSQAGVAVEASSDVLPGGGLGSSAALGVAIGRAVTALGLGEADEAEAIARATAWETVFHGNPSGIDVAVAARGGCVRFTRENGCQTIHPAKDLWLAVGSTGAGASTRARVEGVADLKRRKPDIFDRSVEGIRALVENAALAVSGGDLIGLGKLMDLNQMLLAGLMVSTSALEALCAIARAAGALGAKLTGAGGGGSVLALVPSARVGAPNDDGAEEAAARILAAWRTEGFDGFVTRIRAPRDGAER